MLANNQVDQVNELIEQADHLLNEQRIDVDGESISLLMLQDTTMLALENLSKAYVDIDFEIYKLQLRQEKFEKMEIRRLFAFQKVIKRLMEDIVGYRSRMGDKYPELLEREASCQSS